MEREISKFSLITETWYKFSRITMGYEALGENKKFTSIGMGFHPFLIII
jgi:hypothetical protein